MDAHSLGTTRIKNISAAQMGTECTQAQGLSPPSPAGSAWAGPWETKSIPGRGVFSFQPRKAAKPQHMPIPRPWPQQHSRLVALGHEVCSHLACSRLGAWLAQSQALGVPKAQYPEGSPCDGQEVEEEEWEAFWDRAVLDERQQCVCVCSMLSSLALVLAEVPVQ